VVKSAAVTPGSDFGFAAAKAGLTGIRSERVIATDKNLVRFFIIY
jgi:hypothetical protein